MQTRFNATVLFPLVLLSCVLQSLATLAAEPASKEESFTVVLLPDTQYYSQKYPDTYVAQTLWIRKRLKEDNIKFAIHLGDIVQNAGTESEWASADRAVAVRGAFPVGFPRPRRLGRRVASPPRWKSV